MARIRTIKPEFCQSESIGALSRDARLLFVQLWTIADDAGRLRGASRMLASLLYPYDDDAPGLIGGWLDELDAKGCIRRYEVDGSQYVEIVNWLKHQKIDRPSESRIPPFDEASRTIANARRASDADLGPRTGTKDQDLSRPVAKATRPTNAVFEEFWKAYPKRKGENPKEPARKQFEALVRQGVDPQTIIRGVKAAAERHRDKVGTEFIPQAVKWLRDKRWEEYETTGPPIAMRLLQPGSEEWKAEREAKVARGESTALMDRQAERGVGWAVTEQTEAA